VSDRESGPPQNVPTLTEVVIWPQALPSGAASILLAPPGAAAESSEPFEPAEPSEPFASLPSDDELVQRVLADLQRQVDLMLEYRLREVLAPLLARATDSLIREARGELTSALREMVARAVAQEMSRHRVP
jgi:hypothetical protein